MVAAGGAALAAGPVAAVGAVAGQPGRGCGVAVAGQGWPGCASAASAGARGAGVQGSMWVLVVSATMSPCLRDLTFLMVQRGGRHGALFDRTGVRGPRRRAVAAAGL